MTLSNIKRFY